MFETGYSVGLIRAAAAAVYQVTGEILPSNSGKINMVVRQPLGVVVVIFTAGNPSPHLLRDGRRIIEGCADTQGCGCSGLRAEPW
jgi:hypothetical protein